MQTASNRDLLAVLEQTLNQYYPALAGKLNAGLSDSEIDKVASVYELNFTGEVYDLFSWKNGVQHEGADSTNQLLIFPNGIPFTLPEAAHNFDMLSVTKHFFEPNYFPLFSGGDNDLLLIDLDRDSSTYKMISLYSPSLLGNSDPVTIYDGFSSLLETVISCYRQKAFWIDQDCLQVDNDAYNSIAGNLNPNSQYWQFM